MMVKCSYVPRSFGKSYTVPLLKNSCNVYGKSVTVDDFRGISISPVLSKVLEHCILDRHSSLFVTSIINLDSKSSLDALMQFIC